jgi:hypothetical protein
MSTFEGRSGARNRNGIARKAIGGLHRSASNELLGLEGRQEEVPVEKATARSVKNPFLPTVVSRICHPCGLVDLVSHFEQPDRYIGRFHLVGTGAKRQMVATKREAEASTIWRWWLQEVRQHDIHHLAIVATGCSWNRLSFHPDQTAPW